jgi:uncharacterized protein YbjT (DUF2867 family)
VTAAGHIAPPRSVNAVAAKFSKEPIMPVRSKIAVAGATGRVGRHVVDVLEAGGHEVVGMSRALGVDIITGEGLDDALNGVDIIVDAASWPTSEQDAATKFFLTATRNLQEAGQRAGVRRIVVVSIIGTDRFSTGYNAAKHAHEQAMLAGPLPVQVLRAAQFHEFVAPLMEWGTQGEVSYLPNMRTQLVAARTVAEGLADLATGPETSGTIAEIAGPREENLVEAARLLAARRGGPARVEPVSDPSLVPELELFESGALLPGPDAQLAGPTFEQWLDAA